MSTVKKLEEITIADYLDGEERGEVRHEYVDGFVYNMAGGSARHNLIASTLLSRLRQHHENKPCREFMSDMKVQIGTKFYYPDVMVACGEFDPTAKFETSPVLIIEILSESTEARDRLEKLVAYQRLSSLKEYVLVAQDKVQVEIYQRDGDSWQIEYNTYGDECLFNSVNYRCPIETIYEDVINSIK